MSDMRVWRYRDPEADNPERYAADVRDLILDRPRGNITDVVTTTGERVKIEPGVAWLTTCPTPT